MALETVVHPQDPFSHCVNKEYYYSSLVGGSTNWDHDELGHELEEQQEKGLYGVIDNNNMDQGAPQNHPPPYHQPHNWDSSTSPPFMQNVNRNNSNTWDPNSSSPDDACTNQQLAAATTTGGRRKRRRSKSTKNKEEIENQRMTHIAVERNRRKQMNEYLAVLRSLMPPSYSQRGEQASIIGGAINFVKELEQLLQSMEAQKGTRTTSSQLDKNSPRMASSSTPFAEFFSFPQYSTRTTQLNETMMEPDNHRWAVADIEVTMVESHANMKILSKKRPRQLLKLVAGLQSLRLSILHLNVTTVDEMILYSLSVKVEEGCHLGTVDEIAAGVNRLLQTIEEEATGCVYIR